MSALILAMFFAQQVKPAETCTLSGTVVDSVTGLPISKVEVVAEHPTGRDTGASTETDAKGHFVMVDVDPGLYRLSAKRNGYLDSYYGARKSSANGATLTLVAGQKLEDVQIRLTPFGVVSGTIRDPDGEPMAGIGVQIVESRLVGGRRTVREFLDGTETNDLGEYRIAGVPQGKYYLVARVKSSENWKGPVVDHSPKANDLRNVAVTTYYPGTLDPAAAGLFEVATGARLNNMDITLVHSPVFKVGIHLDAPDTLKTTASLDTSVEGLDGLGDLHRGSSGLDLEMDRVPPGNYRLHINRLEPSTMFREGTLEQSQCSTVVPITVDRGDVLGLHVAPGGCAEITGHVSVLDEKQLKREDVALPMIDFDTGTFSGSTVVKRDGSFHALLSPGHHMVDLSGATRSNGLYVRSILAGNQDVLRHGFTSTGSEQIDLAVILASDGGTVSGVVLDADEKPVLGAAVVLIPNDPELRARRDFTPDSVTDHLGHFEMQGIAPGEYKLFAWDDLEQESWLDPEVLRPFEGKGEAVTVAPKGQDGPMAMKLHVLK
jgi:hypothetical protein